MTRRADLGPQLQRVLDAQPPFHNINVRTPLGAQIRETFRDRDAVFCTFDCEGGELKLAAQLAARPDDNERCAAKRKLYGLIYGGRGYGDGIRPTVRRVFEGDRASDGYNLRRPFDTTPPRGGTRKIAELPRVCMSPDHDPPSMMVYEPGVWAHVCSACGERQVFTVTRPTL